MIKTSAHRLALTFALGASLFAAASVARAQSTGGVTGTDPEPKGCGCVMQPATTSTVSTSSTSTSSTASTVAKAMLVLLGVA